MTQVIDTHTYENGLVLVAESMGWVESAAFTIVVPSGCCYEPDDRKGLSAFTCEMALRGAGSRDNRQFHQALENLGVERSESVGVAHSSFSGATLAENLYQAIDLYTDLLRRPRFPEDELEAGRRVVLQELEAIEDEPAQKLMVALRARHYPDPWGRASHGEQRALSLIGMDEICEQFARLYRPNGTIIGVAGKFQFSKLRDYLSERFEDWKPVEVEVPTERAGIEKHEHLHHESQQTQIGIAYQSVPYCHPDYFQAWGSVGVLSGGMSARLFTEVRERRGLCYSIYASHHTHRDRASVFCHAGTSADRAQETLDVTLNELVRLSEGIETGELERLKARIKSGLIMQQESSLARSGAVARDWYHLGRVRTMDEISTLVDELSCTTINDYLGTHPPGAFTVVTLGPKRLDLAAAVF